MISENKEEKNGVRYETVIFLEKRLGKLKNASKDGALCGGLYNSTKGNKVINYIFNYFFNYVFNFFNYFFN